MKMRKIAVVFLILSLLSGKLLMADEPRSEENKTKILQKAKLLSDVLLKKHVLTYDEAMELWGETAEISMSYTILASGIKNLDLLTFEAVITKMKKNPKFSLFGLLLQEIISQEIKPLEGRHLIFYSIADDQFRVRMESGQEDVFPEGILMIRIKKYYGKNHQEVYVLTVPLLRFPFEKNAEFCTVMTWGNKFIENALGIEFDEIGRPKYSETIDNFLRKLEAEKIIDLSAFRKAAAKNKNGLDLTGNIWTKILEFSKLFEN